MPVLSPGPVFNLNSVRPVGKAETELGSLHLRQIGELQAASKSRLALETYHKVNIDAAAKLSSYTTSAERLEGTSKYPMLASKETAEIFANTAIKANQTAKRVEDKEQAEKIANHAVDYLVEASKYAALRHIAVPQLLKLFNTETLSDNVRLVILKGLSQSIFQSRSWSHDALDSLAKGLQDYATRKGDEDKFALLVKGSALANPVSSSRDLSGFLSYVTDIIEGKQQFPAPPINLSDFSFPTLRSLKLSAAELRQLEAQVA